MGEMLHGENTVDIQLFKQQKTRNYYPLFLYNYIY